MSGDLRNQPSRRTGLGPLGSLVLVSSLAVALSACRDPADSRPREPIVGLPCEGCEAVFEGLPRRLDWTARIAGPDEPGEPLLIEGVVRDRDGRGVPGVIVYAYHTDHEGIYPRSDAGPRQASARHGRLRAWVESDPAGRFRFETIRPAAYPDGETPAHVHMHVIEVGRCTYYIDDLLFADDPRLTPAQRARLVTGRGGPGLSRPSRDAQGAWRVTRDIVLGERIPGHPGRAAEDAPTEPGESGR